MERSAPIPFGKKQTHETGENLFLTCPASLSARLPVPSDRGVPSASPQMILAHVPLSLSMPRSVKADRQLALPWQPELSKWLGTHVLNAFLSWGRKGWLATFLGGGCHCWAPSAHPRPTAETLDHPQDLFPRHWQPFSAPRLDFTLCRDSAHQHPPDGWIFL